MHDRLPEDIRQNARSLRGHQTDAENLLWMLLRNRGIGGFKFRRQHPVGRFVVDFFCQEACLGIEIDGGQHNDDSAADKDAGRTVLLHEQGIQLLRFWNHEVLWQTETVLEKIYLTLLERTGAR